MALCWQTLDTHVSVVHASASSHCEALVQHPEIGASPQALLVQAGRVQGSVSSGHWASEMQQLALAAKLQVPDRQISSVHGLPSSQLSVVGQQLGTIVRSHTPVVRMQVLIVQSV